MGDPFRVTAIIATFNEGDIISRVIGHLVENGVDVYLIDNHSTDDTVEKASGWVGHGLLDIDCFRRTDPSDPNDRRSSTGPPSSNERRPSPESCARIGSYTMMPTRSEKAPSLVWV